MMNNGRPPKKVPPKKVPPKAPIIEVAPPAIKGHIIGSDIITKITNYENILLEKELAPLIAERDRLQKILENNKGRILLNGNNPIDWDDSDGSLGTVQATTIAYGHILNYKQVWRAAGYSLGDLVYSLPLAPGQKKQIAVFDWTRKEVASRQESLDYKDSLSNQLVHDRDINEIVNSTLRENVTANSHAKNEGNSMGFGVGYGSSGSASAAGNYNGISFIGAFTDMLGISGGANKSEGESWSDASQNALRNLAASSEQNLRDKTMQNASSVRSQRASVVTTVSQSESFSVTTEVIANHNHCHALTIQYFEVLRHFAIHQELSDVQECLFIPMSIESFDRKKILRWRDILYTYLYAPGRSFHALKGGFDSLQRAEDYANGNTHAYDIFPNARFCDETFTDLNGQLKIRTHIIRPFSTIPEKTSATYQDEIDALRSIQYFTWFSSWPYIIDQLINVEKDKIEENFQRQIAWASFADDYLKNGLRVYANTKSSGRVDLDLDVSILSKQDIGGITSAEVNNRIGDFEFTVSLRPKNTNVLRTLRRADIESISIEIDPQYELPPGSTTLIERGHFNYVTEHYAATLFNLAVLNNDIAKNDNAFISTPLTKEELRNPQSEDIKQGNLLIQHLNSNAEYYHKVLWFYLDEQRLFNLLDKYYVRVPKIKYISYQETIQGNSVIKTGLQLDNNHKPIIEYINRSVASVVELKRLGMAGNSIVFPVARGFNLNPDFLLIPTYHIKEGENIGIIDESSKVDLIDIYKPLPGSLKEPKPYRISVPTKGLFAEAVMGACNSCEKIDDTRFWKWEEHPIDEPTAINPISTDTRRADPGPLTAKDFPAPIINIQNAPSAPDPQGLANALALMGKSDVFKDFTGLDQNQKNALQAMLSNQEAAKFFAEQATKLATEAGKNTQHAADTVASYDLALKGQKMQALDKIKDAPLDADTKQKLYQDGLNQILGGDKNNKVADALTKAIDTGSSPSNKKSLTDAAVEAVGKGQDVKASNSSPDGKSETIDIKGADIINQIPASHIDLNSIFQIDREFIHSLENSSNSKDAVVPNAGNSGVTVGDGFDLGQQTENSLDKIGLSTALKDKLKPYLTLRKDDASQKLTATPLTLDDAELSEINTKVIDYYAKQLEIEYNKQSSVKFIDLPKEAQTVIYSVYHQYGSLTRTPKFLDKVTHQDWEGTINELNNFGDSYTTRRQKEATYLTALLFELNKSYAAKILDVMNRNIIASGHDSKSQLENIVNGVKTFNVDPKTQLIKVLPVIALIAEKAVQYNYTNIIIGSFIRDEVDGHGTGRCIDINVPNGDFTGPYAVDMVVFVLYALKDLPATLKSTLGFGLPYQGDFIAPGTGTKFHSIPLTGVKNLNIQQLISDLGAIVFPDNNNHLHIQVK